MLTVHIQTVLPTGYTKFGIDNSPITMGRKFYYGLPASTSCGGSSAESHVSAAKFRLTASYIIHAVGI